METNGAVVARHLTAARTLMGGARAAMLATLDALSGHPFASLVGVAPDADLAPLILISKLARHTQNIEREGRVSLLLQGPVGDDASDPLTAPRLSLMGRVSITQSQPARVRYLDVHPEAHSYIDFSDFRLYRLDVTQGHLVAGFGQIATLSGPLLLLAAQRGS